jgi:hypothetical protein
MHCLSSTSRFAIITADDLIVIGPHESEFALGFGWWATGSDPTFANGLGKIRNLSMPHTKNNNNNNNPNNNQYVSCIDNSECEREYFVIPFGPPTWME